MGAFAPLLRDWDLLQHEVVPPLLNVDRSRVPAVWSLGCAADAVAVTVAFDHARGERDTLKVFSSDEGAGGERVSFALADVRSVPEESRSACFSRHDRRWVPGPRIADAVVLAEPSGPVDLVTVRSEGHSGDVLPRDAVDRLRPGGRLLLVDPPSAFRPPKDLRPVGRDQRVFEKSGLRRRDLCNRVDTGAQVSEVDTLAGRQFQQDLVDAHLKLARALAHRFTHHGEATDDLEQVAYLALVKAAKRFDSSRDNSFATYATASILGELKRHFRDKTWMLRVPRSLQETYLSVKEARSELTQKLGASPTIRQIAVHLNLPVEAVIEAMDAGYNYWPASLDVGTDEDPVTDIPVQDRGYEQSLDRERLRCLMPTLEWREQVILKRIYFDSWTQRKVAEEIGVSQMQVSRLLARTLEKLRAGMAD